MNSDRMGKNAIVGLAKRANIPGTPAEYDDASVDVIRGMIKEAVDHVGGIRKFVRPGNNVILKANVVGAIGPEFACTTDPRVLEALHRLILQEVPQVGELGIGDSCASPGRTKTAFEAAGISRVCEKLEIKKYFFEECDRVPVEIPDGVFLKRVMLPKPLLDADVYVNVPKLKCHPYESITVCIKNQHGLLRQGEMLEHHRDDGHQKFVDIYRAIKPDLNVVDGIYAMQVTNVSNDRNHIVKDMNVILAGEDGVAVDAVAGAIMGFSPEEVPATRIASMQGVGIGDLRRIEVRGTPIESVIRRFERAPFFADGIDPDFRMYIGGACIGCKVTIIQGCVNLHGALQGRATFTPQIKRETFRRLFGHLTIISGVTAPVPEERDDGLVIVVGNCAKEHKDRGIFLPGCWDAQGRPVIDLQLVDVPGRRERIVEGERLKAVGENPWIWDLDNLPLMVINEIEKKLSQSL